MKSGWFTFLCVVSALLGAALTLAAINILIKLAHHL